MSTRDGLREALERILKLAEMGDSLGIIDIAKAALAADALGQAPFHPDSQRILEEAKALAQPATASGQSEASAPQVRHEFVNGKCVRCGVPWSPANSGYVGKPPYCSETSAPHVPVMEEHGKLSMRIAGLWDLCRSDEANQLLADALAQEAERVRRDFAEEVCKRLNMDGLKKDIRALAQKGTQP